MNLGINDLQSTWGQPAMIYVIRAHRKTKAFMVWINYFFYDILKEEEKCGFISVQGSSFCLFSDTFINQFEVYSLLKTPYYLAATWIFFSKIYWFSERCPGFFFLYLRF